MRLAVTLELTRPAFFANQVTRVSSSCCRANAVLDETTPWSALKKGSDDERRAAMVTLVAVLEGARIAAVLLAPVTPSLSDRILAQLGLTDCPEVCKLSGHCPAKALPPSYMLQ